MKADHRENDRGTGDEPLAIIERALVSAHDVTSEQAELATEWLAALMRTLWAMRVLDAWASENRIHSAPVANRVDEFLDGNAWRVIVTGQPHWFFGATPEAARLAAAEVVFPTLPADVRAKLGERP